MTYREVPWHEALMFLAVGALCGCAGYYVLLSYGAVAPTERMLDEWHAKRMDTYFAHMNDPQNQELSPEGFVGITEPFDIEPTLSYLASRGQLRYIDLVLPTVQNTAEVRRALDTFAKGHDSIVLMTYNPEHVQFPVRGAPVLHLNIWVREEGVEAVATWIRELEEEYGEANPAGEQMEGSNGGGPR
jgi:hypothetical protein